jgi:Kef-type K+ transport system membrane component KefB
VGLIFAGIGSQLRLHGQPVIGPAVFAAVVVMVIVTTLITPPALKITLTRGDRRKELREGKRAPEPEMEAERALPPLG